MKNLIGFPDGSRMSIVGQQMISSRFQRTACGSFTTLNKKFNEIKKILIFLTVRKFIKADLKAFEAPMN